MVVAGLSVLDHVPTPPTDSPLHVAWGRRNIHSTPSTAKAFSSLSVHPHTEPIVCSFACISGAVHSHAGTRRRRRLVHLPRVGLSEGGV